MGWPRLHGEKTSPVNDELLIGWTTVQSQEQAQSLARGLVENRLAACVQVEGPITSTYRWKGSIETSEEWRLAIKFTKDRAAEVQTWIMDNHPYEAPQWVAVRADQASPQYLEWVQKETRPGQ